MRRSRWTVEHIIDARGFLNRRGESPRNNVSTHANLQFLAVAHPHCCVAFLPFGPIILRSLRSNLYKEGPRALGEHLKKRRLELGLLQKDVAARLNVTAWGYRNWENGRTTPGTLLYTRIVEFLGFYPHPAPRSLGHRLLKIRRCLGLTSRQAAGLAGVDQTTFLLWERDRWTPTVRTRAKVDHFLEIFEQGLQPDYPPKDTGSLGMERFSSGAT